MFVGIATGSFAGSGRVFFQRKILIVSDGFFLISHFPTAAENRARAAIILFALSRIRVCTLIYASA